MKPDSDCGSVDSVDDTDFLEEIILEIWYTVSDHFRFDISTVTRTDRTERIFQLWTYDDDQTMMDYVSQ